jgi:hypothetical protein
MAQLKLDGSQLKIEDGSRSVEAWRVFAIVFLEMFLTLGLFGLL